MYSDHSLPFPLCRSLQQERTASVHAHVDGNLIPLVIDVSSVSSFIPVRAARCRVPLGLIDKRQQQSAKFEKQLRLLHCQAGCLDCVGSCFLSLCVYENKNLNKQERDSRMGRAWVRKVRHTTAAGSIPWCCKGLHFLPESAFSAGSLTVFAKPPYATACFDICAPVKNPKHRQPYYCLYIRTY